MVITGRPGDEGGLILDKVSSSGQQRIKATHQGQTSLEGSQKGWSGSARSKKDSGVHLNNEVVSGCPAIKLSDVCFVLNSFDHFVSQNRIMWKFNYVNKVLSRNSVICINK